MIPLTDRVEQYLAQRERFGTGLSASAVQTLRKFASFAANRGAERVTVELFLYWKEGFGSAGRQSWSYRLSHVRTFARWLQSVDPRTEVPPKGLIPARRRRPRPYIYTDEEIAAIVTEAARLSSLSGLRGPTYAALFGLLAVTGLRIGETMGMSIRWQPGCMFGMRRMPEAVCCPSPRAPPGGFCNTAHRVTGSLARSIPRRSSSENVVGAWASA